ncbi:hypothetical protein BN12_600012 [Nostocoides japonicum T1-X7]|uniref:Uncharacterized protein n=1 Tax=Nostocoides japonicum T1-X7 TaxID=1194083 RepID=A0A077M443_9MICO|nr:hypothetical protein BN12_600012 [Tetrasphaera japonica T1-X7]
MSVTHERSDANVDERGNASTNNGRPGQLAYRRGRNLGPRNDNAGPDTRLGPAFPLVRAVAVGFEPTEGVNPHTLSRRAP